MTYLDKILYLYPDIQQVSYWNTQYDGSAWDDPYDGLIWENTEIEKPLKETLDALDNNIVQTELSTRADVARKSARDAKYQDNVYMKAKWQDYKMENPNASFSKYLDSLEEI